MRLKLFSVLDFTHGVGHFARLISTLLSISSCFSLLLFYVLCLSFIFLYRYKIMTSNIVESVNSIFGVEREFPIIS